MAQLIGAAVTFAEALDILGANFQPGTGCILRDDEYVSYAAPEPTACLDGNFTADYLEAVATVMRETQRASSLAHQPVMMRWKR